MAIANPLGGIGDRRQNDAAEEIPDAFARREERGPQALHALGRLVVEELELRNLEEGIGDPHQRDLREQNEDGERDGVLLAEGATLPRHNKPLSLGEKGGERDDDVEYKACAEPLQQRGPSRVFGAAAGERDKAAVVGHEGGEHEEGGEDRHARRRDGEFGAHASVEGGGLLDEEGVGLSGYYCGYERCE